VRWLRTALLDDLCCTSPVNRPKETEGVAVSLVLDEAEPIGSFVGVCLSEPLLQGGILIGVFGSEELRGERRHSTSAALLDCR